MSGRDQIARSMSEDDLLTAVLDAAYAYGWLVHHSRPASTVKGFRTALQGHPGLPDLVLAHPRGGVLFRELKAENGRLSVDQQTWLAVLADGGANIAVWRPSEWVSGLIDAELREARRT